LKETFEKPRMTLVGHIGPLANEEIAALPDDELAEYLRKYGYYEAKQAALDADGRSETN